MKMKMKYKILVTEKVSYRHEVIIETDKNEDQLENLLNEMERHSSLSDAMICLNLKGEVTEDESGDYDNIEIEEYEVIDNEKV